MHQEAEKSARRRALPVLFPGLALRTDDNNGAGNAVGDREERGWPRSRSARRLSSGDDEAT
jgi:hypothetical protein